MRLNFLIPVFPLLFAGHLNAQNNKYFPGNPAGSIATDAIRMDVSDMSPFFGKFAIVRKNNSMALIDEKGDIVIPYNTYKFNEMSFSTYGSSYQTGRIIYNNPYFGNLARYQKNAPYTKLIPFIELKTDREGYMTMDGKSFFRKKEGIVGYSDINWLEKYDRFGYLTYYEYKGLFTSDGLIRIEKFDGTLQTGKGNYIKVNNKGDHKNINYRLADYSTQNRLTESSYSGYWTNGLMPARYLNDNLSNPLVQKDPAKIREAKNNAIGFINKKGEFQIKPAFYAVSEFSEGISFVAKINEFDELAWGAIDTTGKLVIPYKFKLHPGRFSHGLAIIKTKGRDDINYGFINKQGEILFTIPFKSGDTTKISLGLNQEFDDQDYPLIYKYDEFYFTEGYQFVNLQIKDAQNSHGYRNEVCLLDTLGRYFPIEKKLLQNLPEGGNVKIVSGIKDGQFLYRYYRALYASGKKDEEGAFEALGLADVNGNIIIPPLFQILSHFEKESNLQFARSGKGNNYGKEATEGYIDRTGVFRIIKVKAEGGF